jgi:alcohol dehydrogenase (nicotinoprotein)
VSALTTTAAICRQPGGQWELATLQLDDPHPREVRIRVMAAGLCHSDEHVRAGSQTTRYPIVGGHEGVGVVESVGDGVTRVAPGDHVICSFIPVCGTCRYCSTGSQNLCDRGLNASVGCLEDGTFRYHEGDADLGGMCVLGTFSQYAVICENSCIPIDRDLPFDVAALLSCGVPTGWGTAVYAAGVTAGDTVVIFGAGGIGMNAVQGARFAGAGTVIVVDPVAFKREMAATLGASHTFADAAAARDTLVDLTRGQLADHAIITVGALDAEIVALAGTMIGKRGQVTVTSAAQSSITAGLPSAMLLGYEQRLQGSLFGSCNPLYDVPRLAELYRAGLLRLDELITARYPLEQINDGYRDLLAGRNVRGLVIHEH